MPSPQLHLPLDDVRDAIRQRCFLPGPSCLVGVELEWLTFFEHDVDARVGPGALRVALGAAEALPAGSAVSFEPGGQLELSSLPFPNIGELCAAAEADVAAAHAAAASVGARLVGLGADPWRRPRRVVVTPRYDAMEAYFDARGPAGRRMMCNTAAVQVNVGLGPGADDAARQWRLAHRLGPTLAAAFANSPLVEGRPSGFRSTRLATWWAMDGTRTAPAEAYDPGPAGPGGGAAHEAVTGPDAWAGYALAARVMLMPTPTGQLVPMATPLSFAQWAVEGHELGWPTIADLDYHLGTLFPPVRPRGGAGPGRAAANQAVGCWLELRMLDALPDPWWQVPVAVAAALLADAEAGATADRAATAAGAVGRWVDAARTGLAHPALATSARACFQAALAALGRRGDDRRVTDLVAEYADRWVDRGRCPADDRLDAWGDGGALFPDAAEVRSWT